MMSITGHPGGPPTRLGVPIADIGEACSPPMPSAALADPRAAWRGGYVDVSMLGGQVACSPTRPDSTSPPGSPRALGNAHPMIAPYDTFATADGYVNLAVGNNSLLGALLHRARSGIAPGGRVFCHQRRSLDRS